MCDQSNGQPTEIFFENLDTTNITGIRVDE